MNRICVPLAAASSSECTAVMEMLADACDLFEVRSDAFREAPDVVEILSRAPRPVVWTHRSTAEGGRDNPRQARRLDEYRLALKYGARWVDVEWKSHSASQLAPFADRLILSFHDFDATPGDLPRMAAQMAAEPCAIVKIATRVGGTRDLLSLAQAGLWLQAQGRPSIVIGLGDDGKPLRLLSSRIGCEWTYAALHQPTAPGQITAADLELYRFRNLSPETRIFAVIGNPIAHSLSPLLHNPAYHSLGVDAVCLPVRVDDLDAYLNLAGTLGFSGWSVTLPLKEPMARRCLLQDPASRASGVVNTVRPEEGQYLGWNTDWAGMVEPLKRRRSLRGSTIWVIGTGGVARTAIAAFQAEQATVCVAGRRAEALETLAREFSVETVLVDNLALVGGDVIVNATPVGMAPHTADSPVPEAALSRFHVAYDLVYTPRDTLFLRQARRLGLETISGWEMFVLQAVRQIRIFTGSELQPSWIDSQMSVGGGQE